MTTSTKIASLALSLSLVLASGAAFAGEKGAHRDVFPMAGDAFQQKVEARIEKQRARMEEHLAKKSATPEKASEVRARFDARKAKVEAEVAKAVADGTVTKEEAKAVRAVAREGHPHKGERKPAGA